MKRNLSGKLSPVALASVHNDVVVGLRVDPRAAGAARRILVQEGIDPDLDHTVCLLASELVSNCVRHAQMDPDDKIVMAARLTPDMARVEIRDSGPGFDPDVRHETDGYGLRMLDMLASRWGVDCDDRGSRVWFEVDRRRRRFRRD